MELPAFCDNCGTAFGSGFSVSGSAMAVTLEGNKAGPCPACGGIGSIPDGIFDFIEGAVRVLAGPQRTVDELRTLALILEDARAGAITQEEAISRVEENVPGLRRIIGALVPNTWPRIGVLATIIGILIVMLTQSEPSTTFNTNVDVTIESHMSEERIAEIAEEVFDRLVQPEEPKVEEVLEEP